LNVVLGGDLVQHNPNVAGNELALSSVVVGRSARGHRRGETNRELSPSR